MVEVGGSWSWLLVSVVRCLLTFGELMCHRLSGYGLTPREPAGPWPFGSRHSDADGNGVDLFAALENRTGVFPSLRQGIAKEGPPVAGADAVPHIESVGKGVRSGVAAVFGR